MRIQRSALSAVAAAVATITLFSGPMAYTAEADPTTLADAKAQLDQLEQEESHLGESFGEVKIQLTEGQARIERLNADIAAQLAKVEALRARATAVALTRFQNRAVDTTLQLVTSSDPDAFLNQMATAQKVDQDMTGLLQDFQAQQGNLNDLRRSADAEVAALADKEQSLSDLEMQLKDKMAQSEALINRLSAEEQERLNAKASRDADRSGLIDDSGDADARALRAVRYAVSKVATGQYVWGAEGPNSFDCSGLMLAAYRTVGVSLPHSSSAQSRAGRPVSLKAMKPGDLIFFYSPIHHVGMYIGNGRFVHARNPRNDLEIDGVYAYGAPVISARRILG